MPGIWQASSRLSARPDAACPLLGVLAARPPVEGRMPEERLCRMLGEAGRAIGMDVVVFGPDGVGKRNVAGWTLEGGTWKPARAPLPPVVFDRRFPRSPAERAAGAAAVRALRASGAVLLGGGLPGKAGVYDALARCPALAPLLPPTCKWRPGLASALTARHPDGLFLKPDAGMQGRGTIAVVPEGAARFRLVGRTFRNEPYAARASAAELEQAIGRLTRGRAYVAQPLLRLTAPGGEPFDVRVLVQKDGAGRWRIAGSAARVGAPGGATSNLHGGGAARPAEPFLAALLGPATAARVCRSARRAALVAAREAERAFGRLAELGLDFGVEPDGRLWLLEANARPGRTFFRHLGDLAGERRAAERTLAYARRLYAERTNNDWRLAEHFLSPGRLTRPKHNLQEVQP